MRRTPGYRCSWRPTLSSDSLALLASFYFAVVSCRFVWRVAMTGQGSEGSSHLFFGTLLLTVLTCTHLCVLCLLVARRTAHLVLTVLFVASAVAAHFMQAYGIYLDPGMLRNVLHSERGEAADLLSLQLLRTVLLEGMPPVILLWTVRIAERQFIKAVFARVGMFAVSLSLLMLAVMLGYQDFATLARNQKEARYLITPENYLYSVARALSAGAEVKPGVRLAVAGDARHRPGGKQPRKPVLLMIVVGETARSANWGLNGYVRQTTPQLSGLGVINFPDVTSCGSDTETSLPCMFAPVGRRNYDQQRIRQSESLLHVVRKAGFSVLWRDNQTGCKGVCDGLPMEQVDRLWPDLCKPGNCFDETLLRGLTPYLQDGRQDKVVVLHQLGNHGPAYDHRYPAEFRRFVPTCDTAEIRSCSVGQIVNSYDNALLYTDHFLAQAISSLREQEDVYDTALLYVSDHGESLGEKGLFLHGVPYAIAPDVQTHVPMVLWISEGLTGASRLNASCLRRRASMPVTHDHLFHTVLGLLEIETQARERQYDITEGCRDAVSPGWPEVLSAK